MDAGFLVYALLALFWSVACLGEDGYIDISIFGGGGWLNGIIGPAFCARLSLNECFARGSKRYSNWYN